MLVLYSFYKNVLYISTQYVFSWWSCFSGQPLYEGFIYQLYNITFTSLPIFYYCIYDMEYMRCRKMDKEAKKRNEIHSRQRV